METKTCRKCGRELPLSEFACTQRKARKKPDYSAVCKKCHVIETRKWRQENPKKHRARVRVYNLKKCFGLTVAKYEQMLKSQNGVCAACGRPETRLCRGEVAALCVDHDHETGEVRGLLCMNCNTAIGHVEESVSRLLQLVAYVEKFKEQ